MNEAQSEIDKTVESRQTSRRGLLLGAGALATAVGAGIGWWRNASALTSDGRAGEPFADFWEQRWDTPQGTTLRLQDFRGKPLLINFWATWCPPCIEELPLINAFFRQNQANGWQVIGLAVDRPAAVQAFLKKMPLDFPVGLVGMTDGELGKKLGNPSGSLPFSVVVGAQGAVLHRKLGRLRSDDLSAWAQLK